MALLGVMPAAAGAAAPAAGAVVRVASPAEEQAAVRLPGRTENPSPEEWERVGPTPAPPGIAAAREPERRVRNVSVPTLRPFMPDPAKATGAAMVVAPGGGFVELEMDREGYSVAKWLNERGIAAFVLKYRLAPTPLDPRQEEQLNLERGKRILQQLPRTQLASEIFAGEQRDAMYSAQEDTLAAIRYVRLHAARYGLSSDRIGVIGFSAGAIAAVGAAVRADEASRPDLVAPIYGALSDTTDVGSKPPPAFIAVAADDLLAPQSLGIYTAWRASGAPAELHILEAGGHGFGVLRQGKSSDQWLALFDSWLSTHGFEGPQEAPTRTAQAISPR
jgi:acetyl esterase/lipase